MIKKGLQEKFVKYLTLVAFFSSFMEFFLDEVLLFLFSLFLAYMEAIRIEKKNIKANAEAKAKSKYKSKNKIKKQI